MVMRVVLVMLALVAACSFDERKFGDRFCTGDQDCASPDQACIENTCTQKACQTAADCGADHAFACTPNGCVVTTCDAATPCAAGYACESGFCAASFNVTAAAAQTNRSIAVTFDAPPDPASAVVLANYGVDGLTLSGTPALSGNTVTLETSSQTAMPYIVTVTNVARASDHASLDAATGTFTGRTAFGVTSAISASNTSVLVTFDATPDPISAATLANYSVDALIVSGTPIVAGNTVRITTEPQTATQYMVSVDNVRRATDQEPLGTKTAAFLGRKDFNVIGATAVSSTRIDVELDGAPNSVQAVTPGNYAIGGLALTAAPQLAGNIVTLTTSPQTGTGYTVTVTNVTRANDGEPLSIAAANFTGRAPFNVSTAVSTTTSTIAVTFDAPPNPAEATNLANYSVPGLTLGGTPSLVGNTVTLTTSMQAATTYTVMVTGVSRASDAELLATSVVNFGGRAPFDVTAAASTTSTQIVVTFDAAPNAAQAMTLANYSIPGLTLSGTPALAGSTVTLTTSPQASTSFTVTVQNITRATDAEPLSAPTAAFTGRPPFDVASAVSTSNTSLQIVFDAAPNAGQATNINNYNVPGLALTNVPVLAGNTVTLTTAPQSPQTYAIGVSNVHRALDNEALTITSTNFAGRAPFKVASAASTSNLSMSVTFDAPPDPAQATNPASYDVPGLTLSGTPTLAGTTVTLATSAQTGGQSYTVTVANVTRNSDGEALAGTQATFTGRSGFNVASATSVNSTTIAVMFDDVPDAQALVLGNYDVPGLTLMGAPSMNGNTVTIATSPQAAQTYTVTVSTNVKSVGASPLIIRTASFTHTSFNVASAASLTSRLMTVTFDAAPDPSSATTLANYTVPGLSLSGTPVLAGNTVTLATSSQAAQSYTVTVNNVTRASDGTVLTANTAGFTGRPPFDVVSATSTSPGKVKVTFSYQPNATQATTLANYSIPGLALTGEPLLSGNDVTLTTSLQAGMTYTVTVANVTRLSDAEPLTVTNRSFTGSALTAPTVTNVLVQSTSPSNGAIFYNTGTATVVITGTNFINVACPTGVALDDTNGNNTLISTQATSCVVDSETQITATFPSGIRTSSGWNVRVTNSAGTNVTSTVKLATKAGITISEVLQRLTGGAQDREFVELYNPTANPIDLAALGVQLHFRSGSATDLVPAVTYTSTTIPSHGFLLICSSQSDASNAWFSHRNGTYDATVAELTGNGGVYVSLSTTGQAKVIDKVGWGSVGTNGFEGAKLTDLGAAASYQRKPAAGSGASTDTDNNASDFNAQSTSITPNGAADAPEP
jgi:predicted RNA-binding protein with TRAM domain